jgi:hypothetical protein
MKLYFPKKNSGSRKASHKVLAFFLCSFSQCPRKKYRFCFMIIVIFYLFFLTYSLFFASVCPCVLRMLTK